MAALCNLINSSYTTLNTLFRQMQLQHSVTEVNTFHMDIVITSKIGFCYIVIPWWHMNFIFVACGNHYTRAKLLYLLNVD